MVSSRKDNVLTFILTPDEMKTVSWIESVFGTNEFNTLVNRFLTQRTVQMDDTIKNSLWTAIRDHPDIIDTALNTANNRNVIKL